MFGKVTPYMCGSQQGRSDFTSSQEIINGVQSEISNHKTLT